MSEIKLIYRGGDWVTFRAGQEGSRRRQDYNLRERRWSLVGTPLTMDEQKQALKLVQDFQEAALGGAEP